MPSVEPSSESSATIPSQEPSAVEQTVVFAGKLFAAGILVFVLLCIAAAIAGLGVDDY